MSSKKYHHGNLREALLTAAIDQIKQEGADSLNLSKLSRTIGVSQPAAYRHFANKQDLTINVGIYGYQLMQAKIETALSQFDERTPIIQIMEAHAQAYVAFILENPELSRLMFSLEERVSNPDLYAASKSIATVLYGIVEAAQKEGALQNGDIDDTVRVIWSAIHGNAILLIDEQLPRVTADEQNIPRLVQEVVRVLVAGLFKGDFA
ncbi:MAG: TetR/AcrR family transcriptional regulator [Chloroflexota bacterium]